MRYILLAIILLLSGCSLKPDTENSPIITKYLIPLPENIKPQQKKFNINIKISNLVAPNFLYTNDIVYTKGDGIYGSYLYNFWGEIPSKQIEFMLANALSLVFKNVVVGSSAIKTDISLESRIEIFDYFINEKSSKVRFKGTLFLVDLNSGKVIKSRNFFITQNVKEKNPKGIVRGFGRVMRLFSYEIIYWLKMK